MRLIELALVLAAIVVPSVLASRQGDNYGKNDIGRAAKGAATAAIILQVYSVYSKRKSDEQTPSV